VGLGKGQNRMTNSRAGWTAHSSRPNQVGMSLEPCYKREKKGGRAVWAKQISITRGKGHGRSKPGSP